MAEKACHGFGSTTQVGLTQALDVQDGFMRALPTTLRVLAITLGLVSALHLTLGLRADVLLGVSLHDSVVSSPGLSSQNRFFGVAYALYAAVLWISAGDLTRYFPVLKAALWLTFAAGLSRLISWVSFGPPPATVIALMASEILLPPLLLIWLRKYRQHV